jgi:OOP family OmpA-OmpF porin
VLERAGLMFRIALAAAAFFALAAVFGPHGASLWGVERDLQARIDQAFAAQNIQGVSVAMAGQRAVLSGAAAQAGGAEAAVEAAMTAAGPGGLWAGGVTSVDARDLTAGPPVSPYVWSAVRQGDSVVLSGYAPDRTAKHMLRDRARAVFPRGEVSDETRVAAGAPPGPWGAVARDALGQLARLSRGEARLVDGQLVLLGDGSAEAVPAIRDHYARPLPEPFRARLEINVTGQGIGIAELGEIDLSDANPQACQAGFARLLQNNVINFESGSAAISPSSARLLDNLAAVALRCDRNTIEVAGHTDATGDRAVNMTLSRARADAVRAYLISQGVAADRVTAQGFGPDQPRASNATRDGQAANRRIEFTVGA